MKVQAATTFLSGLLTASVVTAQITGDPDGINDFLSDGPFALHVKGQGGNSTIDGYISTLPTFSTQWLLQYEAGNCLKADNSSYRFYFNYTGQMKSQDTDTGFFVTDYVEADTNPFGFKGKAMSLRFDLNTNVGLPILGVGTAALSGFTADNKAFLTNYIDDSNYVPSHRPEAQDYRYYNWAVCWQPFSNVYAPVLSWVTTGRPHNPTCELVDLFKVNL
ncbi:hypothetical protein CIB48_g1282 [Xylaria polymorpha]|nr:hypothetical protein CIB48_g1282 [Xylaria polymorpha]